MEGAIQTFVNINGLRQHIKSDARIHGVISNGGTVANVVPEYSCADFSVRTSTKSYLDELVEKVRAEGFEITREPADVVIPTEEGYPVRVAFCLGAAGEEVEFFTER